MRATGASIHLPSVDDEINPGRAFRAQNALVDAPSFCLAEIATSPGPIPLSNPQKLAFPPNHPPLLRRQHKRPVLLLIARPWLHHHTSPSSTSPAVASAAAYPLTPARPPKSANPPTYVTPSHQMPNQSAVPRANTRVHRLWKVTSPHPSLTA